MEAHFPGPLLGASGQRGTASLVLGAFVSGQGAFVGSGGRGRGSDGGTSAAGLQIVDRGDLCFGCVFRMYTVEGPHKDAANTNISRPMLLCIPRGCAASRVL